MVSNLSTIPDVSSTVCSTVEVTGSVSLSTPTLPSVTESTSSSAIAMVEPTSIASPLAIPLATAVDSTHSTNTVTKKRAAPRRKPVCAKEAKVVSTPPNTHLAVPPPSTAQVDNYGVPLHTYLADCRCQLTIMEHKLKFLEGVLTPTGPQCNTNDDTPSTSTPADSFGVPLHRYLEDTRCQLQIMKHKLKFVEGLLT